jgi:endonuclease-3
MEKDLKKRARKIASLLKKEYPRAKTALEYKNPLELLIATILSAQCTDARVNLVTKELFKRYKTAKDYAEADLKEFEEQIKSTGFYKSKAKNIKSACKMLCERYQGKVPSKMEELLKLPGVARKTANVVMTSAFGIPSGIPVDTHVHRLADRLGLSKEKDPYKVELKLQELLPKEEWISFAYSIILHGREVCKARNPECKRCVLAEECPSRT